MIDADGRHERDFSSLPQSYVSAPSWSPDSKRIVVGPGAGVGLAIVDLETRQLQTLIPAVDGNPSWSPDGRWIAAEGSHLVLVRPDGTQLHRLTPLRTYYGTPAWAPDSRAVAFEACVIQDDPTWCGGTDIWEAAVAGGRSRRLTQAGRYGYTTGEPEWQPGSLPTKSLPGRAESSAVSSDSLARHDELRATHPVEQLIADGSSVAVQYTVSAPGGRFTSRCSEVWQPSSGALTRFYDSCAYGRLGFAGGRVGWVNGPIGEAGVDEWDILTATLAAPRILSAGYTCCTRPMSDIVGDGPLMVVSSCGPCRLSLSAPCGQEPKQNGELFSFQGTDAVKIATSAGPLTPLSVDAGRILVDHENGTLELLDSSGATLRTYSVDPGQLRTARLQGHDLVVQTPTTLEVADADTGTFLRSFPLPAADATLSDLQDGVAVLVAGTDIHLLRLRDGYDSVIHAAGSGPVLAQLEPTGLFYSYTASDPRYPGRVVFVPASRLPLHG